jgi:hypothetical protein
VNSESERGLLGLAFDPDFENNGFFYVYLIAENNLDSEIRRYEVSAANPNVADESSETLILTIEQPGPAAITRQVGSASALTVISISPAAMAAVAAAA